VKKGFPSQGIPVVLVYASDEKAPTLRQLFEGEAAGAFAQLIVADVKRLQQEKQKPVCSVSANINMRASV